MLHYFGAYLVIRVKKVDVSVTHKMCRNGHIDQYHNAFCGKCGEAIREETKSLSLYPTHIAYILPDEQWLDVLQEITPTTRYGTGVIFAIANDAEPGGTWLMIDEDEGEDDPKMKDFPTGVELNAMEWELVTNYAEIIKALRQADEVLDVEIKTGYIFDEDY